MRKEPRLWANSVDEHKQHVSESTLSDLREGERLVGCMWEGEKRLTTIALKSATGVKGSMMKRNCSRHWVGAGSRVSQG